MISAECCAAGLITEHLQAVFIRGSFIIVIEVIVILTHVMSPLPASPAWSPHPVPLVADAI